MGDDVDSKIATPCGEHAIEYAERTNYDDVFPALITMRYTEYDALQDYRDSDAAGKGMKLLLKVTAEGDLFAETRRQTKKNPEGNFDR